MNVSYWDERLLLALLNFALASGIGWACLCRVSVMSGADTRKLTRAAYAALMLGAAASGLSPMLLREWPGWGDVLMNGAVLLYMASGIRAWRNGVPSFAKSGPGELT